MKKEIHPKYYPKAKVACACGNAFTVGSTKEEIQIEVCSACHPFYTGKEKMLDSAGRAERFKARKAQAKTAVRKKSEKRAEKKTKKGKK
jgi:large subunit ribosomal protein L31